MQTFKLPTTLANGLLLNAWQHNCTPRSCDYSVNVRHVMSCHVMSCPTFSGHSTITPCLAAILKQSFCCTGIPDVFWSDEGPQFTAKSFQNFIKTWEFRHITPTPTYPQSNGKIKATVKSMKKLIQTSWTG